MDAYRSAGFRCPICAESPLREYGRRLICDECRGYSISIEGLADELRINALEVSVEDREGPEQPCPRCMRTMRACTLAIRDQRAGGWHCERDGVWLATEIVLHIGGGASGGRTSAGFGQFLDAGTRLKSWHRRAKKLPPLKHSAPVPPSAFAGRRLPCPNEDCGRYPLKLDVSRWSCEQCKGVFVENAALEALVSEMISAPWQLAPISGRAGSRQCPVCRAALAAEVVEGAPIDRCADHGVWFDPAELETVLQHASGADAYDGGVGGWLRRIFSRAPREL